MSEAIHRQTEAASESLTTDIHLTGLVRFLESGLKYTERLPCIDCPSADLCGAIAAQLDSRLSDRTLVKDTLNTYGILVTPEGLCSRQLIQWATNAETTSVFRVSATDPINSFELPLRITSVVHEAAIVIKNNLTTGIYK